MLITADDITVDAVGDPEAITAPRDCKSMRLRPKGPSPTIAYKVYAPTLASPAVLKYVGEEVIFSGNPIIYAGAIVGYLEMLSGSQDFTRELEV